MFKYQVYSYSEDIIVNGVLWWVLEGLGDPCQVPCWVAISQGGSVILQKCGVITVWIWKKPFYILVWWIILVQTGRNLRPNMYVLQLLPGKLPWLQHSMKGKKLSHGEVNKGAHRHRGASSGCKRELKQQLPRRIWPQWQTWSWARRWIGRRGREKERTPLTCLLFSFSGFHMGRTNWKSSINGSTPKGLQKVRAASKTNKISLTSSFYKWKTGAGETARCSSRGPCSPQRTERCPRHQPFCLYQVVSPLPTTHQCKGDSWCRWRRVCSSHWGAVPQVSRLQVRTENN